MIQCTSNSNFLCNKNLIAHQNVFAIAIGNIVYCNIYNQQIKFLVLIMHRYSIFSESKAQFQKFAIHFLFLLCRYSKQQLYICFIILLQIAFCLWFWQYSGSFHSSLSFEIGRPSLIERLSLIQGLQDLRIFPLNQQSVVWDHKISDFGMVLNERDQILHVFVFQWTVLLVLCVLCIIST